MSDTGEARLSFALRPATLADAEAIARVHEASRTAAFRSHLPPEILHVMPMSERISRWREWLVAPGAVTLVTECEGRIAGFGTLGPATEADAGAGNVGEMPTLYVHPDHWRQGMGRALCDAIIEMAREHGYETLVLWTMETNDPARVFYESLGFRADGAKKQDPGAPTSGILALRFRLDLVDQADAS